MIEIYKDPLGDSKMAITNEIISNQLILEKLSQLSEKGQEGDNLLVCALKNDWTGSNLDKQVIYYLLENNADLLDSGGSDKTPLELIIEAKEFNEKNTFLFQCISIQEKAILSKMTKLKLVTDSKSKHEDKTVSEEHQKLDEMRKMIFMAIEKEKISPSLVELSNLCELDYRYRIVLDEMLDKCKEKDLLFGASLQENYSIYLKNKSELSNLILSGNIVPERFKEREIFSWPFSSLRIPAYDKDNIALKFSSPDLNKTESLEDRNNRLYAALYYAIQGKNYTIATQACLEFCAPTSELVRLNAMREILAQEITNTEDWLLAMGEYLLKNIIDEDISDEEIVDGEFTHAKIANEKIVNERIENAVIENEKIAFAKIKIEEILKGKIKNPVSEIKELTEETPDVAFSKGSKEYVRLQKNKMALKLALQSRNYTEITILFLQMVLDTDNLVLGQNIVKVMSNIYCGKPFFERFDLNRGSRDNRQIHLDNIVLHLNNIQSLEECICKLFDVFKMTMYLECRDLEFHCNNNHKFNRAHYNLTFFNFRESLAEKIGCKPKREAHGIQSMARQIEKKPEVISVNELDWFKNWAESNEVSLPKTLAEFLIKEPNDLIIQQIKDSLNAKQMKAENKMKSELQALSKIMQFDDCYNALTDFLSSNNKIEDLHIYALILAILYNNTAATSIVLDLLRKNSIPVDSIIPNPLKLACKLGNTRLIECILMAKVDPVFELKADPNIELQNKESKLTPFDVALIRGDLEIIQAFIRQKPDILKRLNSDKSTPFDLACARAKPEVVKLLLEYDDSLPNYVGSSRRNPFIIAVTNGNYGAAEYLIQRKFDKTYYMAKFDDTNLKISGVNLLIWAVISANIPAIQFLMQHFPKIINDMMGCNCGLSPLFHAAKHERFEVVKLLVESGAKLNVAALNRETEMQILYRLQINSEIYRYLNSAIDFIKLARDSDPNLSSVKYFLSFLPVTLRDAQGNTLLHLAMASKCRALGDNILITLLLELGVDIFAKNDKGETPLHLASHYNRVVEASEFFIKNLILEHHETLSVIARNENSFEKISQKFLEKLDQLNSLLNEITAKFFRKKVEDYYFSKDVDIVQEIKSLKDNNNYILKFIMCDHITCTDTAENKLSFEFNFVDKLLADQLKPFGFRWSKEDNLITKLSSNMSTYLSETKKDTGVNKGNKVNQSNIVTSNQVVNDNNKAANNVPTILFQIQKATASSSASTITNASTDKNRDTNAKVDTNTSAIENTNTKPALPSPQEPPKLLESSKPLDPAAPMGSSKPLVSNIPESFLAFQFTPTCPRTLIFSGQKQISSAESEEEVIQRFMTRTSE